MTPTDAAADRPADYDIGAFSDTPPWIVDRDELTWLPPLALARRLVRDEIPRITTPEPAPAGPAASRRWSATSAGPSAAGSSAPAGRAARCREPTCPAVCASPPRRSGPTYIKLAQIISSGEGLFPEELVAETKKCRDQVPPEPWDDDPRRRRGRPRPPHRRALLARSTTTPLAAASIAQVHRATLRTGEDVVVKVQRPAVATLVRQDLRVMAWLAPKLVGRIPVAALANPPALVELFAETITEELDFRLEAENMLDVAAVFAELGQRDYVIPRPHPELVTRRVLVMERLDGFKFDDVAGMQRRRRRHRRRWCAPA